ncbi:flagellar hook-basal body complex protein FliE [Enterobacteriaceae bacterium RIT714]|nr:flagellar hook-basal body complex protein FliE [Enterobacteriaceae bacterium RIT714]
MENVQGIGIASAQLALLQRMQQTAMAAGTTAIAPAQVMPASMQPTGQLSFADVLNRAIEGVDSIQHSAAAKQTAVETGISDDLTGAMVESQKASVSFAAMVQVRNKLTTALDEIMNLAV